MTKEKAVFWGRKVTILGVILIVLSIVMMVWGLGTGNEFDEYK